MIMTNEQLAEKWLLEEYWYLKWNDLYEQVDETGIWYLKDKYNDLLTAKMKEYDNRKVKTKNDN